MFPDVSHIAETITSKDYNLTVLVAILIVLLLFFKFLIRLIKQIIKGGTKKVLIEFIYTSIFGAIVTLLSRFL